MDKILKPCPFCGENPQITSEKRLLSLEWNKNYPNDGKDLYINKIMYSVECTCCKLTKFFHTEDEATENWNRRPDRWIPVTERLPESGETVLLCCEVRPAMKRYICDGYYAKAKSIINSCSFDYECAVEYDEEQDEYFLLEGFYEVIKNWDEYTSITIEDFVAHWMPLPSPPESGLEVRP